jgi:hypothetical protein
MRLTNGKLNSNLYMSQTTEDLIIFRISNGIRKLSKGLATEQELDLKAKYFNRLKIINEGQHDDLMVKYENALIRGKSKQKV